MKYALGFLMLNLGFYIGVSRAQSIILNESFGKCLFSMHIKNCD